jgi:hypothetical protein
MEERIIGMLVPGIGLLSGLIATYVSLQNRALLAEVRRRTGRAGKSRSCPPEWKIRQDGGV